MNELDLVIKELEEGEEYARRRAQDEVYPLLKAYFNDKAETYASLGSKLKTLRDTK